MAAPSNLILTTFSCPVSGKLCHIYILKRIIRKIFVFLEKSCRKLSTENYPQKNIRKNYLLSDDSSIRCLMNQVTDV